MTTMRETPGPAPTRENSAPAGPVRAALIDLLYRLGDDSLIMGHRNSEWTGLGPILEEDIAFASMAQDQMGHALAFYQLLHDLGEPEPNRIAFGRRAGEYRCCSLAALEAVDDVADGSAAQTLCNNPDRDRLLLSGDWALALVRQFFFAEADAVRMAALEQSAHTPLAQLARKLRGEIKYHTMHGRMWMQRLGRATDESRRRIAAAVERLYSRALGIFEPTGHEAVLAGEAICPTESSLCQRWREQVEGVLGEGGVALPTGVEPIYGGRGGRHPPEFARLIDSMQMVYRLDPSAQW